MKTNQFHRFYCEIIIALLIMSLPFCLYFHVFFKDNAETLHFMGFTINHGFNGNDSFLWLVLKKLIPVLIFTIWFVTSKFWWRYFILSPLLLYALTLMGVLMFNTVISEGHLSDNIIQGVVLLVFTLILYKFNQLFNSYNRTNTRYTFPKYIFKKEKHGFIQKKNKDHIHKGLGELERDRFAYLQRIFHSRRILEDRFGIINNDYINTSKKSLRVFDILISSFLFVTPILFYFYKLIPENLSTFEVLFITLKSNGFIDVRTSVWYLTHILCFVLPLCIWFVTEVRWWKYAILSPIALGCYQIWEAYFLNTQVLDEKEYLKSIPFILGLIIVLMVLSYFIRYKYIILDIYDQLTNEIKELISIFEKKNVVVDEAKNQFAEVQRNLKNKKDEEKTELLIQLQKELIHKLETVKQVER